MGIINRKLKIFFLLGDILQLNEAYATFNLLDFFLSKEVYLLHNVFMIDNHVNFLPIFSYLKRQSSAISFSIFQFFNNWRINMHKPTKNISMYLETMLYNKFALDKRFVQFWDEIACIIWNASNSISKLHCSF